MFMVRFVGVMLALVAAFTFTSTASAQDDLDCADFATQQDAQAVFNQDPSDPYGLDRDNDGIACEANDDIIIDPTAPPTIAPVTNGGGTTGGTTGGTGTTLPATGATDGMTGLALGLGALLLAAGVGAHVALRRRQV